MDLCQNNGIQTTIRLTLIGERRKTQILKFNSPPLHTCFAMPLL